MYKTNLTAADLIELGECLIVVRNPKSWGPPNYVANRDELTKLISRIGCEHSVAANRQLSNFIVNQVGQSNVPADAQSLEAMSRTISDVLHHEASQVTLIATDHIPPDALTNVEALWSSAKYNSHRAAYNNMCPQESNPCQKQSYLPLQIIRQ